MDIVLIGGGGHCTAVIDVIEQQGIFNIAGIVDLSEKVNQKHYGYSIIGTDKDLPYIAKEFRNFCITIGYIQNATRRIDLFNILFNLHVNLPVIISPSAVVSGHSIIGSGSVIMHMAVINAGAIVGSNCIINTKALIEHDAHIEDHCHISTGAIINGGTKVGKASFVGSGAVCRDNIMLPPNSFIKANSLVK